MIAKNINLLNRILRNQIREIRNFYWQSRFRRMTNQQIFTLIYKNKFWGFSSSNEFFSGSGSHNIQIVENYVSSVTKFLGDNISELTAVDIGCGDFAVGNQLYRNFKKYIAIDVNKNLIEFNKERFNDSNLEFRFLDCTQSKCPDADVIFVRQVLQHLSNQKIAELLSNLPKKIKYLIVSEELPISRFKPNIDIATGFQTRININSGVLLHENPFKLQYHDRKVLCESITDRSKISTVIYLIQKEFDKNL